MMFRRAPMSYLAKPDLIKEFFEELGFRLILTSPHVPPVILLHAGAFYMHFTDYEDEAERELILKLCSAPGLCSSKFKEPCYLSLLCNHLQLPITVTFYRTKTTAIAISGLSKGANAINTEWSALPSTCEVPVFPPTLMG